MVRTSAHPPFGACRFGAIQLVHLVYLVPCGEKCHLAIKTDFLTILKCEV